MCSCILRLLCQFQQRIKLHRSIACWIFHYVTCKQDFYFTLGASSVSQKEFVSLYQIICFSDYRATLKTQIILANVRGAKMHTFRVPILQDEPEEETRNSTTSFFFSLWMSILWTTGWSKSLYGCLQNGWTIWEIKSLQRHPALSEAHFELELKVKDRLSHLQKLFPWRRLGCKPLFFCC